MQRILVKWDFNLFSKSKGNSTTNLSLLELPINFTQWERTRGWRNDSNHERSEGSLNIIWAILLLSTIPPEKNSSFPHLFHKVSRTLSSFSRNSETMESTEMVSQPSCSKIFKAVDLPEAIPPVRPITVLPGNGFILTCFSIWRCWGKLRKWEQDGILKIL